jgi:hypothetical protein
MCCAVYISTDSPEDLAARNSDLVRFERMQDPASDPWASLLDFRNRWYVGSKSGCSCTSRHLYSVELGIGEPESRYEGEQEEIEAALEIYAALVDLLDSRHQVDLVDPWEGAKPEHVITIDASLDEVSKRAFRMFENHKFRLRKRGT